MSPSTHLLRQSRPIRRRRLNLGMRVLRTAPRVLLALSIPGAIAWWTLFSGQFTVTEIVAVGSPRIEANWIRQALEEEIGENLLTLRLAAVEERVLRHPWSSQVRSRKELPSRLVVEVVDRVVAGVLHEGEGSVFLDARGRRIATANGTALPEGAVRLECAVAGCSPPGMRSGEVEADMLLAALELDRTLQTEMPAFRSALTKVEILGAESFRLHSDVHSFPVRVGVEGLSPRLRTFEALASEISKKFEEIVEVDLRTAGLIVVRPVLVDQATSI